MPVRITTWNVNGLRTLRHFHPWTETADLAGVLDALAADVVCVQETKIPRARLGRSVAVVPGYTAYFAFAENKRGYSGVATYARDGFTPLRAEIGFTSLGLHGDSPADRAAVFPLFDGKELDSFDAEGRCVITDHGAFVLFNVYFPNDPTPERTAYKMRFHHAIELRALDLIRRGHRVVIAGDVNACYAEIDHCDAAQSCKERGINAFLDHPPRQWLHAFLRPRGHFIDLFRHFHPDRRAAYTCWNTKINARPANYGTRIDYILVSGDLVPHALRCEIHPDVMGSDHCPVSCELGVSVECAAEPPRECARNLPEFNTATIKDFFAKRAAASSSSAEDGDGDADEHVDEADDDALPAQGPPPPPAVESAKTKHVTAKPAPSQPPQKRARDGDQPTLTAFFTKQPRIAEKPAQPAQQPPADEDAEFDRISKRMCEATKPVDLDPANDPTSSTPAGTQAPPAETWSQIFARKQPAPKCKGHGEPCRELRVNKPGPNKGRAFFLCARPADESCDFFAWKNKEKK